MLKLKNGRLSQWRPLVLLVYVMPLVLLGCASDGQDSWQSSRSEGSDRTGLKDEEIKTALEGIASRLTALEQKVVTREDLELLRTDLHGIHGPAAVAERTAAFPFQELTVFVTRTGSKYHVEGCRYLTQSAIPMKLGEARRRSSPCSVCRPP